jgi:hypothetical protein
METTLDRRRFDRRLYTAASVLFATIVLLGFGRTYYFKFLFDSPPLSSLLVHLHGLLMTAWVVLFVTQVRLISTHRVRLHQRLGYTSIALAALLIPAGVLTAIRAAKYGSASAPPEIPPLVFLIVPLFDLLMFSILFGGAIYYRKRPAAHKGLMVLTAINFLPPAIGRIQAPFLLALGPIWFFGFPTALALLILILDRQRAGQVNRVLLAGTALLVVSFIVRIPLATTPAWLSIAQWLIHFV